MPAEQRAAWETYLTVKACAETAACDERTIRRAIEAGELPARRPRNGRMIRVRAADLDAWLRPMPALGRER
jgi:excisionase family DNA binding protein